MAHFFDMYPELQDRLFSPSECARISGVKEVDQANLRSKGIVRFIEAEWITSQPGKRVRYGFEHVALWRVFRDFADWGFSLTDANHFALAFSNTEAERSLRTRLYAGKNEQSRNQLLLHDFRLSMARPIPWIWLG